jgi:C-terminal processing protease CtpA/Prc
MPNGMWTMRSPRGRLGVQVQSLNEGLAEALSVPGGKGVLVTDVVKDTPAERAGIRAGDVILSVGGKNVEDVDDLQRALTDGGKVSVVVARKGARRTLQADIEKRSTSDSFNYNMRRIRIPDIRVYRDGAEMSTKDREAMEQQLRELRDEVRELKKKVEAGKD